MGSKKKKEYQRQEAQCDGRVRAVYNPGIDMRDSDLIVPCLKPAVIAGRYKMKLNITIGVSA
ncbi:hypothetical protein KEM55_000871, partial [Ascosphaera atra]